MCVEDRLAKKLHDQLSLCEEPKVSQLLVLLVFKPRKGLFIGVVSSGGQESQLGIYWFSQFLR